jgi:hypothetical protein
MTYFKADKVPLAGLDYCNIPLFYYLLWPSNLSPFHCPGLFWEPRPCLDSKDREEGLMPQEGAVIWRGLWLGAKG